MAECDEAELAEFLFPLLSSLISDNDVSMSVYFLLISNSEHSTHTQKKHFTAHCYEALTLETPFLNKHEVNQHLTKY